jgi:uncharacterized protein (TIGR00297 family)
LQREDQKGLAWQSKAILLIVVPWTVVSVAVQGRWWAANAPIVAWQALGIGAVFGLIVWGLRAATVGGALTGAAITANLIFATAQYPYEWTWLHGGLMPLLAVFVLTYVATKIGRVKKERLGTAESKRGRNAAQVAANLGVASLFALPVAAAFPGYLLTGSFAAMTSFATLTALSEAAADTVSSEIGQIFGGAPRMITTLRRVEVGTDGGISLVGTLAGAFAALLISIVGFAALRGWKGLLGYWVSVGLCAIGGTFGLLFDSFLGATLERKRWLNNDAVNFLSTASAVAFSIGSIVLIVTFFVNV